MLFKLNLFFKKYNFVSNMNPEVDFEYFQIKFIQGSFWKHISGTRFYVKAVREETNLNVFQISTILINPTHLSYGSFCIRKPITQEKLNLFFEKIQKPIDLDTLTFQKHETFTFNTDHGVYSLLR